MITNHGRQILKVFSRLCLLVLVILLTSPVTPAKADTSVCGPVSGTWTPAGNSYIVTCNIQVLNGTTLTIQPGVVVKFTDGTSLQVDGELIAQGATFTSSNTSPGMGNWGHIYFTTTSVDAVFDGSGNYQSGSILQGSTVDWGGGGTGIKGEVEVAGASPFLDNNTIRNSSTRGIHATGRSSSKNIKIAENSVSANSGGGVQVSNGELDHNQIFSNSNGNNPAAGVSATNSILTYNEVTGNRGGSGAGIYAVGSTLRYNTVSGNYAAPCTLPPPNNGPCFPNPTRDGGGVYSIGSDLIGNLVSGNSLGNHYDDEAFGGGVYAVGGTLNQNTVTDNVITSGGAKGGGIYSSLSDLTGNEVSSNSVNGHYSSGGGIYSAGANMNDNTVLSNTVNCATDEVSYGGGIYSDGGTVMNNTVNNNSAAGGKDSQGGGIYGSINTISGNSLSGNSAYRGGAIYSYKGTVSNNTITNNTTSWTGSIYMNEGQALGNTLQDNSAVNGGGIYGNKANITGNTVENNTANLGGGILSTESTVRGNTLTGNTAQSDGGGIYAEGGTVTENTLTSNSVPSYGHGSGAYLVGVTDFTYNDVLNNYAPGGTAGGVTINGQPKFQYNNLEGNQPYDAEVVSSDAVTGKLNYWGPSVCTAIPKQIYDGKDAPGRGVLSYAPSLYSPAPIAQLTEPTNLVANDEETLLTLSWTPSPAIPIIGCRVPGATGPDLGYRVYYSIGKPCGPFNGKGLLEGDSPIDAGTATSFDLSGFSQGEYYMVVAAYDYLGRESAFSNAVIKPSSTLQIFLPQVKK